MNSPSCGSVTSTGRRTRSTTTRTGRLFLTVGQLSDLVVTVGFYQLVSNFLNTFGVTTEGETSPY